MRTDDHVQELVEIIVKAAKMTESEIMKALRWFIDNRNDSSKFVENTGKVDMKALHAEAGNVKFLPNEIDQREMRMISKEFEKYNILFAVEKQGNGKYVLAFAGKNEDTIEHAMKQVIKKQDLQLRKQTMEKDKTNINKIKTRYEEYAKENGGKENLKRQQEQSHDREERSR